MIHPDLAGVRTLIFDMDGTLISSGKISIHALRRGLDRFYTSIGEPVPARTDEDLLSGIGAPSHVFFRDLLDEKNKSRWEDFRKIIIEEERAQLNITRITFPGIHKTLVTLRQRGYKLALVSNCGSPYMHAVLDTQNLRQYFDIATCIGDRAGSTKTELIAETAAQLGGKAAVIGDRAYDIEAAVANNLPAVGALYGYGTREELFGTATWVEDIRHLLFLFNPVRELAARIASDINRLRPLDQPFVVALETPHHALSFPLSQHILNELTDLNIPVTYLNLGDYARNGQDQPGLNWIQEAYPWTEVNDILDQKQSGRIEVKLGDNGRILRARAGSVLLIEGGFLDGDWVQKSFNYYIKLNSELSSISRVLRSDKAIVRHSLKAGALTIPEAFFEPSYQLQEWTERQLDLHRAYEQRMPESRSDIPQIIVHADRLERGEFTAR